MYAMSLCGFLESISSLSFNSYIKTIRPFSLSVKKALKWVIPLFSRGRICTSNSKPAAVILFVD